MTLSVLVKPAYFTHPDYHKTFGPEVSDLVTLANFAPDPEQDLILDPMFGVDKRGQSVAFEVAVIGCRQNIKTGLMKIAALGKTVIMERPLFVWSAHEFRTAQEGFRDLTILIESCPDLDQLVKKIHYGNGDEAIEWLGGQRIIFKARTNSGGRGLTGDDVGLDEAFALKPEHMGALLPTLSARPDPQVFYGSSAGLSQSDVLRSVRDRGRAGSSPRLLYAEWCAPDPSVACDTGDDCSHALGVEGCGFDKFDMVQQANPQLGRRISWEYVQGERQALPVEEFARERMGWWDDPGDASTVAIPAVVWSRQGSGDGVVGAGFFALDVSPMLTHAAICVAGRRADDSLFGEIVQREGQDDLDYRPGTDWVIPALRDLKTRVPDLTVTILKGSQAESLAAEIEDLGVEVLRMPMPDFVAACGAVHQGITGGDVWHSGQPELAASVAATRWRDVGEGGQAWGRRKSSADITPTIAYTLAVASAIADAPLDVGDVSIEFV